MRARGRLDGWDEVVENNKLEYPDPALPTYEHCSEWALSRPAWPDRLSSDLAYVLNPRPQGDGAWVEACVRSHRSGW